jgi:hypothetical protein
MLVHPIIAHRAVSLLVSASLVVCAGTSGHVLAASQDPAAAPSTAPTAPPATAQAPAPGSAADLSGQAIERFKARDYDAAARLFEQAYGLDPNPNYLFNVGRVYEEKGDIRSAADYYQRFVKEPGVEIESRELALQRLRVLRAILHETEPKPGEPATATPADPKPGVTPPSAGTGTGEDEPDRRKSMRLGGYALLGVGGVSMVVGGIFGGLTLAKKNDLNDTHMVEDRKALAREGKTFALVSDVTLFTGAALAVAGLVLVLVARKPRGPKRSALAPSLGRGHAGLTWSLRF